MAQASKNPLAVDGTITLTKQAPQVDLEATFTEQSLKVKEETVTQMMQEAFEGTPEGEALGFVGEADTPVTQAGIIPEPEGISTARALGEIVFGGPTDAFFNSATNITAAGQELRDTEIGGKTVQQYLEEADQFFGTENFFGDIGAGGLLSGRIDVPIGTMDRKGGTGVQLLRGLTAFATSMMTFRGMGANTFGSGVGADLVSMDLDNNLSNMFNEFVPEGSPFRNPITDFLAAKSDDSTFAKALKSAGEGIGIAIPLELGAGLARLLKRFQSPGRTFDAVEEGVEAGVKQVDEVADVAPGVQATFGGQVHDISAMQLPFEKINNEKILRKISDELEATLKERSVLDDQGIPTIKKNKKGREVAIQAADELKAREKFFADPEGEAKRLLEFDPNKKLNRVDEIEFALLRQASFQRIDDLAREGGEASAEAALQQFRFHMDVIEEQSARFSEAAGRDLAIRNRLKKGDLGKGQKVASVGEQMQRQVDDNIDPLAFAQKWRETNPEAVMKEAKRLGGADMFFEAWVNSLFGIKTHVVNIAGNVMNIGLQTVERGVAAQIRRTKRMFGGSAAGVQAGEAQSMLYGMLMSQPKNFAVLAKNLGRVASLKEIPASQFQKLDQANVRAITGKNFGLKEGSFMYQGADMAGHLMSSQGKLLLTMDEYFKMNGYTAEIYAQAHRTAMSEGKHLLGKKALNERIAQLLENPSPSIKANAENFADYATFTKELGQAGKKMHDFIHSTPLGRYVVPFHNVLVNLAKFSGERTPLALFSKKIRADIAAGGAKADLAQARIATGTAASMAFLSLALGGGLTGNGPQNAKMREAWRRKGNQPYSVVVMGKDGKERHISIQRAEPIAFFAGMMADFVEIADQISEGERIAFAQGFVLTMSQHFLSQTFAKSVSDFMLAFQEGRSKFFENLGSSVVPFGGVFRDLEKVTDPTLRDTKTVDPEFLRNEFVSQFGEEFGNSLADSGEVLFRTLNNIKANLPGYSEDLPPRVNMWGEEVAYEKGVGFDPLSPFFIQTKKDSPVDDWILELKVPVGLPEPVISNEALGIPNIPGNRSKMPTAIRLKPEEYHEYVVLAGESAFKILEEDVKEQFFLEMPDIGKADYIQGIVHLERAKAAQALVELKDANGDLKYPELAKMLSDESINARIRLIEETIDKVTTTPRNR